MFTLPLPFGVKLISPFDDVVILTTAPVMALPLTSNAPPSCGVVSSTTSVVVSISEAITQFEPLYFKMLPDARPEVSTSLKWFISIKLVVSEFIQAPPLYFKI